MRLWLLVLVMLAAAMPLAHADLCSNAGSLKEDCKAIMGSDLGEGEKREAAGVLLAGDSWQPAHDAVLSWNRKMLNDASKTLPSGTPSVSKGSIRNAWVKLLGLHPTTREQGTLFHSGEGLALLASHYDIVPHAGKLPGDCRTDYRPQPASAALTLLANGISQGSGSEVQYSVNGDATFTAQLDIIQTTYVDRYKWYSYCCQWGGGCTEFGCWSICTSWCGYCYLDRSETWNDHVLVKDALDAKLYSYSPDASLTPVEQYGSTVKAVFSPDSKANTRLNVGGSRGFTQARAYFAELTESGLETLTVAAEALEPEENITMLLPAGALCELEVADFFGTQQLPCSIEYIGPQFKIFPDKHFYKAGEIIHVAVAGTSDDVTLDYAGQKHGTSDEDGFSLRAEPGMSLITAYAAGREASAVVGVVNPVPWRMLLSMLVLLLAAWVTYSSIRGLARRFSLWDAA